VTIWQKLARVWIRLKAWLTLAAICAARILVLLGIVGAVLLGIAVAAYWAWVWFRNPFVSFLLAVVVGLLTVAMALIGAWLCWRTLICPWLPMRLNWREKHRSCLFRYSNHRMTLRKGMSQEQFKQLLDELRMFGHFNFGHNKAVLCRAKAGYVYFESLGFFGVASGLINPRLVPVRLRSCISSPQEVPQGTVIADTATGHMLVGQRRWIATALAGGVDVRTEAHEMPRDRLNAWGMRGPGGKLQLLIWYSYFENIREAYGVGSEPINTLEPGTPRPLPATAPGDTPWCPL
jgi:hypothetical protein